MSNYDKYLEEANNIDFKALGESWAAKILPNQEIPIDYKECAEKATDDVKSYINRIRGNDAI